MTVTRYYGYYSVSISLGSSPADCVVFQAIRQGVQDGHYFSIAPSIVRDPSQKLVATTVPFDRLVLESDAPALGPVIRERNSPLNVLQTVDVLAELLGCSKECVIETTTQNALRLFPKLKNFVKL